MAAPYLSPEAAAAQVAARGNRPRVVVPGNFATPWTMVEALDSAVPEWTLHMLNAQPGAPVRDGVTLETCFVGPGMRRAPTLSYVPSRLSLVPVLLRTRLVPDVVVLHVAPPRGGVTSLGIEVNILPAAVAAARSQGGLVIAVVNPRMPFTYGDAVLPLSDVDVLVEIDSPLTSPGATVLDDGARGIGARIASRVGDGSTLQAGIGAIPDAALQGVVDRRGLRVWSEMISDGVLELERVGALDVEHAVCTSFLFGSPELYSWAHDNERIRMIRTETANDPSTIAAQPQMVSVNSALEVDLFDQANASRVRSTVYSGFGGQSDFVVGALHSAGGQALIAMRSWHPKADCSTIVPLLDEPVTSFQHTALVTEHGTAQLAGADQRTQARELIEHAADPRVREELWEEAAYLGLGG